MSDNDMLIGELKGKVDGLKDSVDSLCGKVEDMLSAHATCRQEVFDKLAAQDARVSTIEGYMKKAVLIGVALVSSGAAGSELVKKLVEALTQ